MSTCFSWKLIPQIPSPLDFALQLVSGEFVGDLKGRSKATAFTLGRWLWLIMLSHKMQKMPCGFQLVLCSMYPAYASNCGPCQPKEVPGPPSDISLGTHRTGSYVQTTAFHKSLHKVLFHASISTAGRPQLL